MNKALLGLMLLLILLEFFDSKISPWIGAAFLVITIYLLVDAISNDIKTINNKLGDIEGRVADIEHKKQSFRPSEFD